MSQQMISAKVKSTYGMGGAASAIKDVAFSQFMLFYYSQVLGLSPALAGTALFIALLVDAITDPMIGYVSDTSNAKRGRRHAFMFWSIAPTALAFYALMAPPDTLQGGYLFAWLLFFSIAVRFAMTWFLVPFFALGAEMSTNYDERTSIASYRNLFTWIVGAGISVLAYAVIFKPGNGFANGLMDPGNYLEFGLISVVLLVIFMLIPVYGTDAFRHRSAAGETGPEARSTLQFFHDVGTALTSHSLQVLLGCYLLFGMTVGMGWAFYLYVNSYFWGLSSEQIAIFPLAGFFAIAIGFAVATPLGRRYEKRSIMLGILLFMGLVSPLAIILRLFGWFPDNGTLGLLVALTVFYGLYYAGILMNHIFTQSMMADSLDEHEHRTGRSQEGIFFAALWFSMKASTALGTFAAGILLELISFPKQAEVGSVAPDIVFQLGVVAGPVVSVFFFFAVLIFLGYRLNRETITDIRTRLG